VQGQGHAHAPSHVHATNKTGTHAQGEGSGFVAGGLGGFTAASPGRTLALLGVSGMIAYHMGGGVDLTVIEVAMGPCCSSIYTYYGGGHTVAGTPNMVPE